MNEFNEAMFKTKVDNIFVKLYTCITKGNLTDVKHFISKDLEDNFQNKINEISSHNQRQIYDEINVKNTKIIDRVVTEEKEIIKVEIISRYMDYIIDLDTGDTIRGDDTRRIEKTNILTFKKRLNTKNNNLVMKCPGCGASINVNNSGKCEYCDTIFDLEDYDYILVSLITN